jgi:hypothetical protein
MVKSVALVKPGCRTTHPRRTLLRTMQTTVQGPVNSFIRRSRYLQTKPCNFLYIAPVYKYGRNSSSIRPFVPVSSKRPKDIRGAMKLLDICVIGLVSIVILSRFPSPLNSLKCDLISKTRLTALSAVCDLLGLLVACDHVASRFSPVGQKHPGWAVAEIVCLVASGLLLRPAFRAILSRLFSRKSSRTQPVKAAWHPDKIRLTR